MFGPKGLGSKATSGERGKERTGEGEGITMLKLHRHEVGTRSAVLRCVSRRPNLSAFNPRKTDQGGHGLASFPPAFGPSRPPFSFVPLEYV
jgi:hypothetical protein